MGWKLLNLPGCCSGSRWTGVEKPYENGIAYIYNIIFHLIFLRIPYLINSFIF